LALDTAGCCGGDMSPPIGDSLGGSPSPSPFLLHLNPWSSSPVETPIKELTSLRPSPHKSPSPGETALKPLVRFGGVDWPARESPFPAVSVLGTLESSPSLCGSGRRAGTTQCPTAGWPPRTACGGWQAALPELGHICLGHEQGCGWG
jgi:hypothetical protein